MAIEALLWDHPQWAEKFCGTVESMTEDPNPAVRYAAVSCAAVWHDKDKSEKLIEAVLRKHWLTILASTFLKTSPMGLGLPAPLSARWI